MVIELHFEKFFWWLNFCFAGLLPHLPVVVHHPPGDIHPHSSAATAPPLCHHKKEGCPTLPLNAPPQWLSDGPRGPPSAEVLPLKEDARLHPLHLHPDTGGAPCWRLSDPAGIHDPLAQHPAASRHRLQTAVTLPGGPSVPVGASKPLALLHLTSAEGPLHTVANPSAECPALQSHATIKGNQGSHRVSFYLLSQEIRNLFCKLCSRHF